MSDLLVTKTACPTDSWTGSPGPSTALQMREIQEGLQRDISHCSVHSYSSLLFESGLTCWMRIGVVIWVRGVRNTLQWGFLITSSSTLAFWICWQVTVRMIKEQCHLKHHFLLLHGIMQMMKEIMRLNSVKDVCFFPTHCNSMSLQEASLAQIRVSSVTTHLIWDDSSELRAEDWWMIEKNMKNGYWVPI